MVGDHQISDKPTKFCRPDDWVDFGRVCACGKPAFVVLVRSAAFRDMQGIWSTQRRPPWTCVRCV